jgi:hypothetical protein
MRMQQLTGPSGIMLKLKGPLKELPSTDPGVECGLLEEIEGKSSLWEKEIPKVRWKECMDAGQDCQEVVLECENGALRPIAAMHVWRDQLEGGVPLKGDCLFISRAGFVIQDLEINKSPRAAKKS